MWFVTLGFCHIANMSFLLTLHSSNGINWNQAGGVAAQAQPIRRTVQHGEESCRSWHTKANEQGREHCSNTELKSWHDRLWWQGESLQTPLHPTTRGWKKSWASLFSGCIFKHLLWTKSLTEFPFLWLFSTSDYKRWRTDSLLTPSGRADNQQHFCSCPALKEECKHRCDING